MKRLASLASFALGITIGMNWPRMRKCIPQAKRKTTIFIAEKRERVEDFLAKSKAKRARPKT